MPAAVTEDPAPWPLIIKRTSLYLSVLNKNAILIPTPGQTEQEYLAKYHSKLSNIIWTNQTDFKLNGNNDFGKINSFTNEKLLRTEITKIGL